MSLAPNIPTDTGAKTIVNIQGLRKSFGSNEVLKGIDLQVQAGEVIAIIGKSGSGKSTLLRCINGLEEFQSGSLTVDGKPLLHNDPVAMRELRQHVGMIFQSFNLFPAPDRGQEHHAGPAPGQKGRPDHQRRACTQVAGTRGTGRKV
jgi:polar amino acid transport system ATP-binding protein